jgi:hypothetical protein
VLQSRSTRPTLLARLSVAGVKSRQERPAVALTPEQRKKIVALGIRDGKAGRNVFKNPASPSKGNPQPPKPRAK